MLSWLIPKEFCCGLICAGLLKNLNTSTVLQARLVYLSLSLFISLVCIMVKLFAEDVYNKLKFMMPDCYDGTCFSTRTTHALMLSLACFHFCIILITELNKSFSSICYKKCWVLKFLLYFGILFGSVLLTSALVTPT